MAIVSLVITYVQCNATAEGNQLPSPYQCHCHRHCFAIAIGIIAFGVQEVEVKSGFICTYLGVELLRVLGVLTRRNWNRIMV